MMEYILRNGITIIIDKVQVTDAAELVEYMQKVTNETSNLLREPGEFKMTVEQEEDFIKNMEQSNDHVMFITKHDGMIISAAGFHGSSLNRIKHRGNVGISILKAYHHMGIGTILMNKMIEEAKIMGKTKLDLEVREDNPNAIKLYEKVGFVKEGLIRNGINDLGHYVNLVQMGIVL